ncbi:MAG: endonuclease/exonuclease/phosphatase family protein [Spirochaetota bacterium]|jgi:endonuclease/exonuclease/phosphatase family metal-dependent hydrolase|nr:endonuclease/exonuclease/phosphatase family protein [Spirochaetota bacterium]
MYRVRAASLPIIPVFALILSACSMFDEPRIGPVDPVDPGWQPEYTIMSYNICGFDKGFYIGTGGDERITQYYEIAGIVKTNNAAVLCMQEVSNGFGEAANLLQNFDRALRDIDHAMPYYARTSYSDGLNSVAYSSRYPVSEVSELGNTPGASWTIMRSVQRYKVTFPGNVDVWFYGCHFSSATEPYYAALRKNEARNLAQYIRERHDLRTERIIILGDMNTIMAEDWPVGLIDEAQIIPEKTPTGSPTDSTLAWLLFLYTLDPSVFFTSLTHLEIYPTATYMIEPDWFPLDHFILSPVLYKEHYVPDSTRLLQVGGFDENPSDHYPMVCKLSF